ncbi:MFS transporter [Sporomusa termitida]|uniref:Uncharacterized protein n=1 Tax=Sporomusa termitida TaxID=2377 RepID=A0A517DSC1_9FIRM|nr:MFS transporter [Sporomusa termitida]QDR80198.1 hypothetical protein SPTER_15160 [Sporomusa termitida]
MEIISALSVPIMILNMFGGIIAGIWLIIIGKWAPVGIAIATALVSSFVIGFAMLPAMIFSIPAAKMINKGTGFIGYFLFFCSSVYVFGVLWYWSIFIFGVYVSYIGPGGTGIIPLMIMAYSVATAPVGHLASKESDSPATMIATFCTMVGCMVFMLSLIFNIHPETGNLVFIGIMALGVFAQLIMIVQVSTAMKIDECSDYIEHPCIPKTKEDVFAERYEHEQSKEYPNISIDFSDIPLMEEEYAKWKYHKEIATQNKKQITTNDVSFNSNELPLQLDKPKPLELIDLFWVCALQEAGTTLYENIATSPSISGKIIWESNQGATNVLKAYSLISLKKVYLTTNSDMPSPQTWDILIYINKVIISQNRSPFAINQELFGEWTKLSIKNYLTYQGVPYKVKLENGSFDHGAKLLELDFDKSRLWLIYMWSFGANGKLGNIRIIIYPSEQLAKQDEIWSDIN